MKLEHLREAIAVINEMDALEHWLRTKKVREESGLDDYISVMFPSCFKETTLYSPRLDTYTDERLNALNDKVLEVIEAVVNDRVEVIKQRLEDL